MSELPRNPDPGQRRRAAAAQPGEPGGYWSLGGAGAVMTAAGRLSPSVLLAGPDRAVLEGSLVPSAGTLDGPAQVPAFTDVIVTDDRGMRYGIEIAGMSGPPDVPGVTSAASVSLRLQPTPARGCDWLDVRGEDGSACRLLPSPRPAVRASLVAPATGTAAERELSRLALSVIRLEFHRAGETARTGRCSAVLARIAQLRQSGGLDPASELPGQIAGLCDVLTGHGRASEQAAVQLALRLTATPATGQRG